MHEYQLVITKRALNPDYDKEYAEWLSAERKHAERRMQGWGDSSQQPQPSRVVREEVLTVTVDAETFETIRRAALETL